MINLKATLRKLTKRFPQLTVEELLDIVDCYVEHNHELTHGFTKLPTRFSDYQLEANH